jgi:hypothetical protein
MGQTVTENRPHPGDHFVVNDHTIGTVARDEQDVSLESPPLVDASFS